MRLVKTVDELRRALAREPGREGVVGLVPTMGAYHDGHLALFHAARTECDMVVASLFVNPAQFGAGEDFDRYPRDLERDARIAEAAGIDLLFAPPADELYPDGYQTWVDVTELGQHLEGEVRPDHFRGVATVCLKLFNLVAPRIAYFGRKDAQQVAVVKAMVRDLEVPLQVRVIDTVRDEDGLALSSRNAFLSTDGRRRALGLPSALRLGLAAFQAGRDPVAAARAELARHELEADYVEVADLDGPTLAAAVRVDGTRLIDNALLVQKETP